jgi:hypothetical protein
MLHSRSNCDQSKNSKLMTWGEAMFPA